MPHDTSDGKDSHYH